MISFMTNRESYLLPSSPPKNEFRGRIEFNKKRKYQIENKQKVNCNGNGLIVWLPQVHTVFAVVSLLT